MTAWPPADRPAPSRWRGPGRWTPGAPTSSRTATAAAAGPSSSTASPPATWTSTTRRGWTSSTSAGSATSSTLSRPRARRYGWRTSGVRAARWRRYVAATRPGSRQVVFEIDAGVLDLARRAFGLRSSPTLRLVVADARAGLEDLPAGGQDVVVRDAFSGASVPSHLTTSEFLAEVRRVLTPGGLYLANLADSPHLNLARREAATALASFVQVALIAEPGQLHGRRYGNVVLAASDADLPWAPLERRLASGAVRARHAPDRRGCGPSPRDTARCATSRRRCPDRPVLSGARAGSPGSAGRRGTRRPPDAPGRAAPRRGRSVGLSPGSSVCASSTGWPRRGVRKPLDP